MLFYVVFRVAQAVLIAVAVTVVVFVAMKMVPGDPADMILGAQATVSEVSALRERLGLNDPMIVQYGRFFRDVLRGDFGVSYRASRPIREDLFRRYLVSLQLAGAAMALAAIIGVPLGVAAGLRAGRPIDTGVMALAVLGMSLPVYWLGLMLIIAFSVYLGWLPSSGWGTWQQAVLPALTLCTNSLALLARLSRSSIIDVMSNDYIRTARSKGLPARAVVTKHALRNALIPIVTVFGLSFGQAAAGAVVTETVFAIPGLGRWIVDAIRFRDVPVVQAGVMFIALNIVLVNLVVDISYAFLNPKVRFQ